MILMAKTRKKSVLATFENISPNKSTPRHEVLNRLTPHSVAGNLTAQSTLGLPRFKKYDPKNGASCNYAIDSCGKIGLGVPETDRAWTSSSSHNDHHAVTFEIANDSGSPEWHISKTAINAWINLCVDICKFYGFKKVNYKPKPANITIKGIENWIATWEKPDAMTITLHYWFKNKECPGKYLINELPGIVKTINGRLAGTNSGFREYFIQVTANALNIRSGPGTNNFIVSKLIKDGYNYTIVSESTGQGANRWGKLKSGIGWIALDYTKKV